MVHAAPAAFLGTDERDLRRVYLLARTAPDVFQIRLPLLGPFALRLGDDESSAADVFGFPKLLVRIRQNITPSAFE
jgi:hypothetical protein